MKRMLATVQTLRAYVRGQASQGDADQAATELVQWSNRMGELFPPEVSAQYADISPQMARQAPEAMSRTAGALLNVVQTGTRRAAGDQLARTERDGCGFCHRHGFE
jgi:hypothetical protein